MWEESQHFSPWTWPIPSLMLNLVCKKLLKVSKGLKTNMGFGHQGASWCWYTFLRMNFFGNGFSLLYWIQNGKTDQGPNGLTICFCFYTPLPQTVLTSCAPVNALPRRALIRGGSNLGGMKKTAPHPPAPRNFQTLDNCKINIIYTTPCFEILRQVCEQSSMTNT